MANTDTKSKISLIFLHFSLSLSLSLSHTLSASRHSLTAENLRKIRITQFFSMVCTDTILIVRSKLERKVISNGSFTSQSCVQIRVLISTVYFEYIAFIHQSAFVPQRVFLLSRLDVSVFLFEPVIQHAFIYKAISSIFFTANN